MAGGTFDALTGKTRPGTYINFVSTKTETVGSSSRGTVVMPLLNHNWGPENEYITLTNASPDAQFAKLGYSIYDTDENSQMIFIKEAFKNASTVIVYRVNSGVKATSSTEFDESDAVLVATAKYSGTRGNALSYAIVSNPVEGYDVTVYLAGSQVSEYTGLTTLEELAALEDSYIVFSGTGSLEEIAGVSLAGGTNTEMSNSDMTTFLDSLEFISFNTACLAITDSSLQTAAKTKVQYMRESIGQYVQFVMPDYSSSDYEGIINVTNSVYLDDVELTTAQACAWVAGATAGAATTQSNTYVTYDGATAVASAKSHEDAEDAIKNGEFFFSISEAGDVVVEYDINSLTSFTDGKDSSYRKNRVIRVLDGFASAIKLNFPPNKFDNSSVGWDVMDGIGKTILKQFEDAGAISDVDYDADFLVDRTTSSGDETFFNVAIKPVDSAEKLFFTIATQ